MLSSGHSGGGFGTLFVRGALEPPFFLFLTVETGAWCVVIGDW